MTQPDGGQSPYDPPQQPQQPEQGQPLPPQGVTPGEPSPYHQQTPYPPAQQGPVYAQGAESGAYGGAPMPKNNLGVWSLVLGILSILGCGLLTGIAAIVTGAKSRRAQREGLADNGGMGLAGLIMGWIGTVLVTLAWVGVIGFFGFLVNSPDFQEGVQEQLQQEYQQEFEREFGDDPSMDASMDAELQELLDQLENG